MSRMTLVFMLITASAPLLSHERRNKHRTRLGYQSRGTDTSGKFPYVVDLVKDLNKKSRGGSGTLISSEWVLTAAHCIDDEYITHIRYGNTSAVRQGRSHSESKIIRKVRHPAYRKGKQPSNNIGLLLVSQVSMKTLGILSAIDYGALMGEVVTYAGYGSTYIPDDTNKFAYRPLQIGEGVVTACKKDSFTGPCVCVAPKCSDKVTDFGSDIGGPLFFDGKIVGIVSISAKTPPIVQYTAVSPFLTWIHQVMTSKSDNT